MTLYWSKLCWIFSILIFSLNVLPRNLILWASYNILYIYSVPSVTIYVYVYNRATQSNPLASYIYIILYNIYRVIRISFYEKLLRFNNGDLYVVFATRIFDRPVRVIQYTLRAHLYKTSFACEQAQCTSALYEGVKGVLWVVCI